MLGVNHIFNYGNAGTYAGFDHRTGMHFTCDDGRESMAWMVQLMQVLNNYYLATKNNIKIRIVKDDILNSGLVDIWTRTQIDNRMANEFTRLYVNTLLKLAKTVRANWVIDTRIKPIENSRYKIIELSDKLVVGKNI